MFHKISLFFLISQILTAKLYLKKISKPDMFTIMDKVLTKGCYIECSEGIIRL